jgi:hypothetical protein
VNARSAHLMQAVLSQSDKQAGGKVEEMIVFGTVAT